MIAGRVNNRREAAPQLRLDCVRELDRGVVENKRLYLTGRMLCLGLWVWLSWWSICSECMKLWIHYLTLVPALTPRRSKVQGHPPFIASLRPAWAWIIGNPDKYKQTNKNLLSWYLGGRQAVVSFSEDALLELKVSPLPSTVENVEAVLIILLSLFIYIFISELLFAVGVGADFLPLLQIFPAVHH